MTGEITIQAGKAEEAVSMRIWVDANYPVIRLEIDSQETIDCQANLELWRNKKRPTVLGDVHFSERGMIEHLKQMLLPDTVLPASKEPRIAWYHRNETSVYPAVLKNRHLGELVEKYPDPLKNQTFGGYIKGNSLINDGDQTLKSSAPSKHFTGKLSVFLDKSFVGFEKFDPHAFLRKQEWGQYAAYRIVLV